MPTARSSELRANERIHSLLEFLDAFAERLGIDLRFPIASRLAFVIGDDAIERAGLQVDFDVQRRRTEDAARTLEVQRDDVLAGSDRIASARIASAFPIHLADRDAGLFAQFRCDP